MSSFGNVGNDDGLLGLVFLFRTGDWNEGVVAFVFVCHGQLRAVSKK
jgi:hypothetical protein